MEHNFPNMFLVIVEPSWCKYWGILYLATYSQHHLQCVCHMNVPRFPSATRLIVCRHFPRKRHLRWMICLEGERCWFQTCRASVFGVSSVFQQNLDKYVWHSRWKVTASVSLRKGTVNEETLGCSQIHCTKWFQKKTEKPKHLRICNLVQDHPQLWTSFLPLEAASWCPALPIKNQNQKSQLLTGITKPLTSLPYPRSDKLCIFYVKKIRWQRDPHTIFQQSRKFLRSWRIENGLQVHPSLELWQAMVFCLFLLQGKLRKNRPWTVIFIYIYIYEAPSKYIIIV